MLCGHRGGFIPRYVKESYPIECCPECGLTQLHPMPAPEALSALYEGDYFGNRASGTGYDDYAEQEEEYTASFREEVRRLRRYVPSGRVLDVGCGYGYFMNVAQEEGYDACGIDVSANAVQEAERRLPGHAFHGDVRECPRLQPGEYDAIFVSHLVEHVWEPKSFVEALSRLLTDRGVIVFVTPNVQSLLSRISGPRWVSLKVPEHVAYYSPATLGRLLDGCGLECVKVETAHQYYRLAFVAEKARALTHPVSRIVPPFERLAALRNRLIRIPNGSMRVIARKKPVGDRSAST